MYGHRCVVVTQGALALALLLTPIVLRAGDDAGYAVCLASLQVEKTKASGSAWDVGGGLPDLMVLVSNERSGKTFISKVKKDTDVVTYDKAPILEVSEGDILDFLVLDEDLIDSDIVGISRIAITTELLAKKQLDLSFGRVTQLRIEFRPYKPAASQ